jgi:hypothetical protein
VLGHERLQDRVRSIEVLALSTAWSWRTLAGVRADAKALHGVSPVTQCRYRALTDGLVEGAFPFGTAATASMLIGSSAPVDDGLAYQLPENATLLAPREGYCSIDHLAGHLLGQIA